MVLETAGKLHPALFYGGLLAAVRRRNSVTLAGHCRATGLARDGDGWRVTTSMGEIQARHVVVATNGYTSRASRRACSAGSCRSPATSSRPRNCLRS